MKSWMQQAREAAGLTTIECAKTLLLSEKDYLIKETNPGMLTIDELVALSFELNERAAASSSKAFAARFCRTLHLFRQNQPPLSAPRTTNARICPPN